MAFKGADEAGQCLAIGQPWLPLGALQEAGCGFFVHRQNHRVLWRLQVKRHNVCRLLRERRIGADAPAPAPIQRNTVRAQHPPDLVLGDITQVFGQQGAVPPRVAGRRRRVQCRENALLRVGRITPRLAAARCIRQIGEPLPRKAATPLADRRRTGRQPMCYRRVALPLRQGQNDLCANAARSSPLPPSTAGSVAARWSTPLPPLSFR